MGGRKPIKYFNAEQEKFVRMEANGISREDIIWELYELNKGDEGYHAAECRLSRWSDHPEYERIWRDEVRKQDFGDYTKARRTLRRSMDDSDKWLAMQSAVNVLNNAGKRIFGDEERQLSVKIEGLPDLGSPDDDDG